MKKLLLFLFLIATVCCFGQISAEENTSDNEFPKCYDNIIATIGLQRFCVITDSIKRVVYADTIFGNVIIINKLIPGDPPITDYDSIVIWWDAEGNLCKHNLRVGEMIYTRLLY